MIVALTAIRCGSDYSAGEEETTAYEEPLQLTEEELKQQLLETECSNGAEYLNGTLKFSPIYKNAFSLKVNGLKLACDIKNKATLATLKDIKAKVTFESKTGAKILEREFDIYEYISPNSSIIYNTEIEISNQQYKDISSYSWVILESSCK